MERKGSVGLDWLFRPRSVAIVGSAKGRTAGGEIPHSFLFLLSLKNMGFQGPVYVVSRSGSHHPSLEGQVFPSLLDIPGPVDHVIVCTPAAAVAEVLRECGEKGVRSAAIFSSGFGESEDPEGQKRQEDLARIAREAGVRLIGPNCMGLYCPETGLNFRADLPRAPGWTAMVSQSGGMAIRTIFQGVEKGLGFSKVVSYGNEVDLQSWELLEFLADDEPTRLILAYIEGTRDGRSLLRSIKKASSRKPVLVLKGGLCKEGSRAASSHTGSMAGNGALQGGKPSGQQPHRIHGRQRPNLEERPAPGGRPHRQGRERSRGYGHDLLFPQAAGRQSGGPGLHQRRPHRQLRGPHRGPWISDPGFWP